jgi:DNA invertase Pin-like site-specific DNA recombinase
MGKTKRVGIYLRVSTSGQTVENQRIDLERVAEQRGWQIVANYIDHGISGSKGRDKRPQFDQLAKDAAQGKLDIVAAWSIDRIGRSLGHLVEFMDELRQQGVGIYLHQQQVDTNTAAGRAFLQMAGVFAEFERAIIVERIHAGLARARAQGKKLGRLPISNRTETQIRNLRQQGLGKLKIARTLRCGVSTVQRVLAAA